MKLSIVATSDLHGNLPEIKVPVDIAIIAGDIVPLQIQFDKTKSKKWFESEFAEWIKEMPVNEVFMIPGNHDAYFENIKESNLSALRVACHGKLKILINQKSTYIDENGLSWSIFGTPYCREFGNWPFMRPEKVLKDKFREIPDKVDIIISHDPPYNYGNCDIILEDYSKLWEHLGSEALSERLFDVKYKILFCGHIHSGDHKLNEYNVVNVSHLNESYVPYYSPFYTEIEHDLV